MYRRALIAMDLSPATAALTSALPLLRALGTEEIRLVHVVPYTTTPVADRVAKAKEKLTALVSDLELAGFRVDVSVPSGAPRPELIEEAEKNSVDMIVMGTRSHNLAREAFIGSVAWDVVGHSRVPVLLKRIRPSEEDGELEFATRLELQGILHPTDFSEVAARAFAHVETLVSEGLKRVALLFVSLEGDHSGRQEERAEARSRLEGLANSLRERGATEVDTRVVAGTPSEEILAAGNAEPGRLLVLGTHGRGFLPGIVLGSASREVVRRASNPVLLVPPERD